MAQNNPHTDSHHDHDGGHHIVSARVLLTVFGALVALTILTVVLALMERSGTIHFGDGFGSVGVALIIAGVKATLVAMYFMALKYDSKLHTMAFLLSILFLVVFFVITYFDTGFRGQFDGVHDARALDMIIMEELDAQEVEQQFQGLDPMPVTRDTLLGPPPVPEP